MAIVRMETLEAALAKDAGELWNVAVDEPLYRKHEGISQSDLKLINTKSPLHYMKERVFGGGRKQTPAMLLGSAMHTAFFEPEEFDKLYIVAPKINRRTNAGKEEFAEFVETNKHKTVITQDQRDAIDRMMENIEKLPEIREYTTGGEVERCFFRPSYEYDIPVSLKARMDYWIGSRNTIVDLKTTICASADSFLRSVIKYGYYVQAAFYSDMIEYFGRREMPKFIFICVENHQPYDVAVYELDHQFIRQGRSVYRDGLAIIGRCFQNDDWPGYPKTKQVLECPDWSTRQWKREMLEAMD